MGRGQSTLLTRISQVDTIHVRVNIPERDFMEYQRRGEERRKAGSPVPLKFELVLSDGSVHPQKGDLVFVDRAVDGQTGTILVEVAFPNPGGIVRPGQFARVRVAIDEKKDAILVPQRAVTEMQGVYSVAVVKPDDTVDLRMVKAAERIGTDVGHRLRAQGGREDRGGRRAEGARGHQGDAHPHGRPWTAAPAASAAVVPAAEKK